MSRYQRRAIGWAIAAAVALLFWWVQSGGSSAPAATPTVSVVEVARPLAAGDRITAADVAVRRVAYSRGLIHNLTDPTQAIGRIAIVALVPGSPLMDAEVGGERPGQGLMDVAVKVDTDAGVPAGDLAGTRGDVLLTQAGRVPRTSLVLENVLVVAAAHTPTAAIVTLRLPPKLVLAAVRAETAGDLRLVAHAEGGAR